MDKKVIYGKIIGGKLYRFPGYIYEGECVTSNPKEEDIFKHGFKKVIYLDDIPDSSQYDYRFVWRETNYEIIQEVQSKEIETDPGSKFHRFYESKRQHYKQVREALQEVQNHRKNAKEDIFKKHYLSSLLYDYFIAQHPDKPIDEQIKQLHPGDKDGSMLTSDGEELQSIPSIAAAIKERHLTVRSSFSQIAAPLMHLQLNVAEYEYFHYRMIFCYIHTLFDDFLSKTIRLIITLFPAGAEYNTSFSLGDLFESSDIVELREKTIDKKIDSFGHENYQKKMEFIKRHGIIPQMPEEKYKDDMILFCEIRNILVHNDGVVNRVFLEKIKDSKCAEQYTLGEEINITHDAVSQALSKVEILCADLYERIKEKFTI